MREWTNTVRVGRDWMASSIDVTQALTTFHPDKTYIGKISSGFNFLGYQLSTYQLTIHPNIINNHRMQLQQRY